MPRGERAIGDILRGKRGDVDMSNAEVTRDALVRSYCSRLRSSNLVDCRDVVKVIGEALEDDEKRVEVVCMCGLYLVWSQWDAVKFLIPSHLVVHTNRHGLEF